jgi:hypothetical protein
VTVTLAQATGDISVGGQSNRGDFYVQIGPSPTRNVADGVLISSVAQNGRNNNGFGESGGLFYASSSVAIDNSVPGAYYVPVFKTPELSGAANEANINVAVAYFAYEDGFIGALVQNSSGTNGGANNFFASAHPDLVLGTHFIDLPAGGQSTVDLRSLGIHSQTDGILLGQSWQAGGQLRAFPSQRRRHLDVVRQGQR